MSDPQKYALELVSAPASEPVTLGELRSHLKLSQTGDDTEIANIWVPAARRLIEQSYNLRLVTQTWKAYFDRFPCFVGDGYDLSYSELPLGPVQSVTNIKYLDTAGAEQTLATSVYHADCKRPLARLLLKSGQGWPSISPSTPNAVYVTFVCGYGTRQQLPANLRAAVMLQARAMFDGETELDATVKSLVALEWSGALSIAT